MAGEDDSARRQDEADVRRGISQALLQEKTDMSRWTNHDLLHWFIDQSWLEILPDFQNVNGEHLVRLRDSVEQWLADGQPAQADGFPLHIAGDEAVKDAKVNSLRSLGYALLQQAQPPSGAQGGSGRQSCTAGQTEHAGALQKWGRTVNIFQACHKRYSLWYGWWATAFTVFVVSLNAVIGGAIFSSITESEQHSFEGPLRLAAAVLSVTSGVAAAVRSALRLEATSEQHAAAAKRFAKLYVRFNDMSLMLDIQYKSGGKKTMEWQDWFKDYMDVMEQAPMISDRMYEDVRDVMYPIHRASSPSASSKPARVSPEEV